MNNPFISIVIPAKNAQSTIRKCLDSIFNLNYRNYEVIAIDDGSIDDTAKILADYQNLKVITTAGKGPSRARNVSLEQARGEFIAFTDADCVVDAEWLVELLKGFSDEKVVGVGGTQRSPSDDSWFGKEVQEFLYIFGFISDYMKSAMEIRQTKHNPSCNVMYRKHILIELGGFLEGLWPGEDVELDYRIRKRGYLLMFNPEAAVFHYRPDNLRDFSRMMFRYGRAQGLLVKKYGVFRMVHFVPIFIFLLFLLFLHNIFLSFLVFALIIIPLFIKLLIRSKNPLLMLRLFFITIFTWNLGFLYGLFKKKSVP